jgi:hypothetical protein
VELQLFYERRPEFKSRRGVRETIQAQQGERIWSFIAERPLVLTKEERRQRRAVRGF